MQNYNFTASELYAWMYSLSREMTGLDDNEARLKFYVYETAIGNLTKNKVPVISTVDDEFKHIDLFSRKSVMNSFIIHIGIIDSEFPLISKCISELFRINNVLV